jgi:hypothetical protein
MITMKLLKLISWQMKMYIHFMQHVVMLVSSQHSIHLGVILVGGHLSVYYPGHPSPAPSGSHETSHLIVSIPSSICTSADRCTMSDNPPNHHLKLFSKGITTLSHISSKEHKNICSILLGLVVNLPLPHGQLVTTTCTE